MQSWWRMGRKETLNSLIHLNTPLADLDAELAVIGWGNSPAITLMRQDIIAVLDRYTSGELDAATIEAWANLIEGRDDIQGEAGHEETVLAAIHDLANPRLQGRLEDISSSILALLHSESCS